MIGKCDNPLETLVIDSHSGCYENNFLSELTRNILHFLKLSWGKWQIIHFPKKQKKRESIQIIYGF